MDLSKKLSKTSHTKHGLYEFTRDFDNVKLQENKAIFSLNFFHISCHSTISSLYQNEGTTLLFIFTVGIFHIDTM